jgi:hypothetical protein
MANFAMFLLADAFAKREGESSGEALRFALPAALLPSTVGLAVAVALASRAAPAQPPGNTTSGTPNYNTLGKQGQKVLGTVIPPPSGGQAASQTHRPHAAAPFFPSFIGYSVREARITAQRESLVIIEPDEEALRQTKGVVVEQEPRPGAARREDMTQVRLVFG